jgi:hypothetical protein
MLANRDFEVNATHDIDAKEVAVEFTPLGQDGAGVCSPDYLLVVLSYGYIQPDSAHGIQCIPAVEKVELRVNRHLKSRGRNSKLTTKINVDILIVDAIGAIGEGYPCSELKFSLLRRNLQPE